MLVIDIKNTLCFIQGCKYMNKVKSLKLLLEARN
jgi:hypothetical protein